MSPCYNRVLQLAHGTRLAGYHTTLEPPNSRRKRSTRAPAKEPRREGFFGSSYFGREELIRREECQGEVVSRGPEK